MFDIGWSELLVIAVVAIVVVGPKDLPRLMRTFGHYAGKLRRMATDFQTQFEQAMSDAELEEMQRKYQAAVEAAEQRHQPVMLPKPGVSDAAGPAEAEAAPSPVAPAGKTASAKRTPSKTSSNKPAPAKRASAKRAPAKKAPAGKAPAGKTASTKAASKAKPAASRRAPAKAKTAAPPEDDA